MRVSKEKALKIIDEKISQFQKILSKATYETRYNEDYHLAHEGAAASLTELFSEEEATEFKFIVNKVIAIRGGRDRTEQLQEYKNHINDCIAQLKVYRLIIPESVKEP